jgi:UDP-glucose:(heptosyl)LPS alpha-1,3-glucosyltransferase
MKFAILRAWLSGMGDGLRIAIILDRYDPALGGLESWTDGFSHWLVRRGHDVSILAFGGQTANSSIRLRTVDGAGGPLSRAAAIAGELSKLSFDIVHDTGTADRADVFQPHTGSRLINAEFDVQARTGWPRLRSRISPRFRRWRREIKVLERRQFADPLRLIAVSAMVRDQIASRYGLDPARITVIHNGIDTRRFAAERLAALREPARARWSLGEAPTFLLVANNFHLKGLDTALGALARLSAAAPAVRLAIAGSGDAQTYRRLARRLGIAGQVLFLGRLDRIEEAYAAADVAIQPTHYDACSLATLEGLASGLPTVTTRCNGAAELIVSGEQGIVLERSTDIEALAQAMQRLLESDLRQRMGLAARSLGLKHDVEDNYISVEAFYRQAMRNRRAGSRQAA